MIRISVSRADATVLETETLTAGRIGLVCEFVFSSDWDDLEKVAVFDGEVTKEVMLDENNRAIVPAECMATAGYNLRCGAYGMSATQAIVIPTVWAKAGKIKDSAAPDESLADFTPTLAAQVIAKADSAEETANTIAERASRGEFDGFSPYVGVAEIENGHRVSITDSVGTNEFNVMDGADGANGDSPTIAVSDITGGHVLTITDINGTRTVNVLNGEDGAAGADGYSPTVTVTDITGGHRVTITDLNGNHTFDVMDGEDGEGGSSITVDSALSNSSTNPVQNKVIKAALDGKGTYSKPNGGIPASDLAAGVIPTVPTKTSDLTNDSGYITGVADGSITEAKLDSNLKETVADVDNLKNAIELYKFDELFSELQISEAQNLYNKDTADDGYIAANGNISPSTTYCHSAKIPVEVGKTYSFWALYNGTVVSANARFLCAYDSNGDAVASAGSNSAVASYTVPDGIASIVVSFEQNRKHIFMVVDGTTQPDGLLSYNLEHYIASTNFISEAVGNILRANEQMKMSVPSATANTEYKLAENLDNKKNCEYSFFGKFASFTSVEIGHGKTETAANYLVIDGTNITSYRPNGTEYAHYAHNLSISDFICVSIKVADTPAQRATVTIITNGGSATVGNVIFFGCNGPIYFSCGQETTEVDFSYSIMDLRKDVYVFGDSYISLADDKRWPNYAIGNMDNNMLLCGFPGANAQDVYPSFVALMEMKTPKYIGWFLGMNNPDGSDITDSNWVEKTSLVVAYCKSHGIVPILATIPNTPTVKNTLKNAWVKASGERYVDFAKAVGAEDAWSTWYAGMLSSDNVHPTAEGAKALWLQMRMDVPEIIQPTTT